MGFYTIIWQATGQPVLPLDSNDHEDQGMLVYRSLEAAEKSANRQMELYVNDEELGEPDDMIVAVALESVMVAT